MGEKKRTLRGFLCAALGGVLSSVRTLVEGV